MGTTTIEARIERGKLVPLNPLELPDGEIVKVKIELPKKNRKKFLNALQRLKGTIKGAISREEWYDQTDLY